ncbi:formin-like protein 3 [Belonocnema kinseyi]|uniref:formin-like protein 3 n=1 Tax=Belonocnema kinseyi TaxID=2817044 RepID=UPI00143D54F9|nr:formin-like protein 3 [Belonocnema kinseyi]
MSKSVPDRWLQYKPYGAVIEGTKILAFKVPLREGVAKNLQQEQRFTTAILRQSFPKLKYVVDLTNTSRYYDKKEFTDAGVQYEKVMVPGIQVPPMDAVKKFFKAMENFTAVCGDDQIIGVHCTHGINRTGYFICRYLVQQLGWKLSHALKAFQDARGYPIERQTYVAELKRTPCGKKIDTSKVVLTPAPNARVKKQKAKKKPATKPAAGKPPAGRPPAGRPPPPHPPFGPMMGPPGYGPPRRGFANGVPFPPPRFGFGPPPQPGFGPRLPPHPMPPGPLPPPGPRFGPRLGPRMGIRPPMPPMPPHMGPPMPHPRGPLRMPLPHRMPMPPRMGGPPRMHGPPRLPMGPMPRLPPPKMAMPRHPVPQMPTKRNAQPTVKRQTRAAAAVVKATKDQDFTADTFEENLAAQPAKKAKKAPVKAK